MNTPRKPLFRSGFVATCAAAAMLALSGCATSQPYSSGPAYGTTYGNNGGGYARRQPCNNCGTVQDVRQVYVGSSDNNHVLGTIIGAAVGGALGNQVGKGDGRKAATVAGAVAGGFAGHEIAKQNSNNVGYQIRVRLDDGRIATVTQRQNPGVQPGDYVVISNDHVYAR